MYEAAFCQRVDEGSDRELMVICELCPHKCHIPNGRRGVCGTRANHDGRLIVENYGMVSSLSLDPIEKKPLSRFMPGSMILSAGSYGCNFHCPFCQNHDIARPIDGPALCRFIEPADLVDMAVSLTKRGNIGLAYTYNEPITWYEYVLDTATLIKEKDMKNVLVSNGFISERPLLRLLPLIDAANIDLKGFSEDFYHNIAGGRLDAVKHTINLMSSSCHVEVTTLVIPGLNDSHEQMHAQAAWLASISTDIPLHLSRFFPNYKMLDRQKTPAATLYELQAIAREYLNYVYLGNI